MDFITDLTLCERYDQLWVIIERYTKMAHLIPLKKKINKAEDLATIFRIEVRGLQGILADINSGQDTRVKSTF
jgi:hypothetical protein